MKKMAMVALVLMMAFVLSAPVVFAQQQTAQPQTAGWYCPMMNQQAAQGGWYCPMMQAAGQGRWYCPMMNQGGMRQGTMGYGCMMNHNQAQPPVQQ